MLTYSDCSENLWEEEREGIAFSQKTLLFRFRNVLLYLLKFFLLGSSCCIVKNS